MARSRNMRQSASSVGKSKSDSRAKCSFLRLRRQHSIFLILSLLLSAVSSFLMAQQRVFSPIKLDPMEIPLDDRTSWHPKQLVAILGLNRGAHWPSFLSWAVSKDRKWIATAGLGEVSLHDAASLKEV